ncbi:hypothetical protein BD779DRAFT_1119537 [Infundibulicybe gibba]|nr:hypothetical protein BD779DRAFT_1119537 [Infundibulicybe gibba]
MASPVIVNFSLGYGTLVILLLISIYLDRQNGLPPRVPRFSSYLKPVTLASILLFLVVTEHCVVTIYRLSQAFGNPTRGPMDVIGNVSLWTNVTEIALAFLLTVLGDCIIIYRLWMIWGCNCIVVIFPILSAVGECVSFVGLVYRLINAGTGGAEFLASWNRWIIRACVFALCTNIYCSGLIMWRLLVSRRKYNPGTGGDVIARASIVAVESAALYTAWAIFFFASHGTGKGIYYPFSATVWPPFTGIAIKIMIPLVA